MEVDLVERIESAKDTRAGKVDVAMESGKDNLAP